MKERDFQLWKRDGVYYYRLPGQTSFHSTKKTTKDAATEAVKEMRAGSKSSALTFRQYAEPFFRWETCPRVTRLRDEGKTIGQTHVRMSRRLLEKHVFKDRIFPALPMKAITRGHVLDLRARLRGTLGANTLNKTITAVKTILSEACFRGDIPVNPGSMVGNIAYQPAERGVFTVEEAREILAGRPGEMKTSPLVDAVVSTLLCTGVRVGELRALKWGAVDLKTGRAVIREAFKGEKAIGDPKWGKKREIALPHLLLDRLSRLRKGTGATDEDFVFLTTDGRPPGQTWIANNFKRVLAAADAEEKLSFKIGGRWLTPHSSRHSVNTHLLAAGVPPLLVQTFLGWSSQEQKILTRVQRSYTELRLFRLEDVAEKIDELYSIKAKARRRAVG